MNIIEKLKELMIATTPAPWEAKQNSWDTSTIYDSQGNGIIRCKIRPHDEDTYERMAEEPRVDDDIIALLYNNAESILAMVKTAQWLVKNSTVDASALDKLEDAVAKLEGGPCGC